MKESAAFGLGEVITLTSAEALKPSVLNITGPLIRILGDRFTWNVKVAILQTLTLLLAKVCFFNINCFKLTILFYNWNCVLDSPSSLCVVHKCVDDRTFSHISAWFSKVDRLNICLFIFFMSKSRLLSSFHAQVGVMLKPFLPQLQTTFVKALNDPNRTVRLKAAAALGKLSVIHTRVDPLFIELHTGVKNADETSIR